MRVEKWYDSKAIVIVLTVIFFPVGIYALWKGNSFEKIGKIVITTIVGLLILSNFATKEEEASLEKQAAEPQVVADNQHENTINPAKSDMTTTEQKK